MAKFDLESYKSVQDRITEFWEKYPDGAIQTSSEHYNTETGHVLFKASVFSNAEKQILLATGYAEERRDFEKQKNAYGKDFESVNYTSHVENAETSCIGRALANAGFATSQKDRPSREEMAKVQRMTKEKSVEDKVQVVKEEPPFEPQEVKKVVSVDRPTDDFTADFDSAKTKTDLQGAFTSFQKRVKSGEFPGITYKQFMDSWRGPVLSKLATL